MWDEVFLAGDYGDPLSVDDQRIATLYNDHVFIEIVGVCRGRSGLMAGPKRHLAPVRSIEYKTFDARSRLRGPRDLVCRMSHESGEIVHIRKKIVSSSGNEHHAVHHNGFHRLASILNGCFIIHKKRGWLSQRPVHHVGDASQRRVVGAAASGDANACDVRDQNLGDTLGIETGGAIALPLRIADAAGDSVAQGSCQRRVDLHQVGAGGAELIDLA
jgi:hypothetical protein